MERLGNSSGSDLTPDKQETPTVVLAAGNIDFADLADPAVEPAQEAINESTAVDLGMIGLTEVVQPPTKKVHVDRSGKKPKGTIIKPKGGRGHFAKHLKTQLSASGKLNANPPMSPEQKRIRRKKRKK